MILKTLQRTNSPLRSPSHQLKVLSDPDLVGSLEPFDERLAKHIDGPLRSTALQTLQINLGKVCNQTCSHCHVDAGPDRRESMSRETAEQVVQFMERSTIQTLDVTGGAPEMNANFCRLVEHAHRLNISVIDRCNLTILLAPGFTQLPEFLAKHRVRIVASLPCYLEENCDAQRGTGVFAKSILAIRVLNELGYGVSDSGLELDLVYNPVGTNLPPDQESLERDYREQLWHRYAIHFNRLLTITNMPISRYLDDLLRQGEFTTYMNRLVDHFNPGTVAGLMCRSMVSVDWRGYLYDCDFNQMLDLAITDVERRHISTIQTEAMVSRLIQTGNHCYGCTAGQGSSCNGSIG